MVKERRKDEVESREERAYILIVKIMENIIVNVIIDFPVRKKSERKWSKG